MHHQQGAKKTHPVVPSRAAGAFRGLGGALGAHVLCAQVLARLGVVCAVNVPPAVGDCQAGCAASDLRGRALGLLEL